MTKLENENGQSINLRSLDALRGFLALYVLLGHCRWLLWAGNTEWNLYAHNLWANLIVYASASLRYGHEAVMIFFVLSGFFIHLRISKQLAVNKAFEFNLVSFFRRRCHRLAPPYFFALALTVICDLIGNYFYPTLYQGLTGDPLLDQNFQVKEFSLASIIPALFMLPTSLGKDFGSNDPLWSLAYEVIYYIVYPLWICVRRIGILPAYSLGIGVAIAAGVFSNDSFVSQVLIHYPIWLAGALISEIITKKQTVSKIVVLSKWLSFYSCVCLYTHKLVFGLENFSLCFTRLWYSSYISKFSCYNL